MSEEANKGLKPTSIRLPADIHRSLRFVALDQGISMQMAINQAVEAWLRENQRPSQHPGSKGGA